MPLVPQSSYRPPIGFGFGFGFGFGNGHWQSIFPAEFRRVEVATTRRERIWTPDGDFLDLDWSPRRFSRLAIISHGLEGSSTQTYIQGMAKALMRRGWDALAMNLRGCSGEPNIRLQSYHSGATGDLEVVVDHVFGLGHYDQVALVGFSLGGNITLKYLGDLGGDIDPRISAAVAISVPCDLASSAAKLAGSGLLQRVYMERFLKSLRAKIREKMRSYPGELVDHGLDEMRTFAEFDEHYTAPMNGFDGAVDYWTRCSSKPVLPDIRIPALLINAADDPFLGAECYPIAEAEASEYFFFEQPRTGGHVGFVQHGEFWSESRAAEFLERD